MNRQKYTVESLPLNQNGGTIEVNCADVTFINYGTGTLTVNGILIPPPTVAGQWNAFSIGGNLGEMDVTKYNYQFGAGTAVAVIVKRNYA